MNQQLNEISQNKLNNIAGEFESVNHSLLFSIPSNIDTQEVVEKFIKQVENIDEFTPCQDIFIVKPVSKQYRIKETSSAKRRPGEIFIEDILEFSQVKPKNLKYSWTIIYDFDKMSNNSDLLLKTIEEPQDNKVFLLTSSSPRMISQTIHSRCLNISLSTNDESIKVEEFESLVKEIINNKSVLLEFTLRNQLVELLSKRAQAELKMKIDKMNESNQDEIVKLKTDEEKQLLKNLEDDELKKFIYCLDCSLIENNKGPVERQFKDLIGSEINKDSLILRILDSIR